MALTGRDGQSGGPQYGWGEVPNNPGAGVRSGSAGSRTSFNSGLNSGRYTNSPEAGLQRGSWQWQGHGPSAQRDYGWDYQGGVGRDEITQHTEARGGGSYLSRMAQDRSGGLPHYSQDYGVGDRSLRGQGGYARDFDRGGMGGYSGGGMGGYGGGEYDQGYRASGGVFGGSGNRYGRGDTGFRGGLAPAFGGQYGIGNEYADRYDRELRARDSRGFGGGNRYGADFAGGNRGQMNRGGYQEVTYGFGPRQGRGYGTSGGYGTGGGYSAGAGGGQRGGYARDFGQGRALSGRGGGYGADYSRPLTDDEFFSRVDRW
jgi:hypothetical protein